MPLRKMTRGSAIVGALVVVLALVAAYVGWNLYQKATTKTVTAYFNNVLALYPGDKVQIMGVKVGEVDTITPVGDKMKVTFSYPKKYNVPANATASVLNPTVVASRVIQLDPPYTGGPVLPDNAVIPLERTQTPVEWDDIRGNLDRLVTELGPTPGDSKGPLGDLVDSLSNGLNGRGQTDQHDAEVVDRRHRRSQRGPRRPVRGDQEPGAVRERPGQGRRSSLRSTTNWRRSPTSSPTRPGSRSGGS